MAILETDEYDPSPAALKPLLDLYWSSAGWREPPQQPSADDRAALVSAGLWLPPLPETSHDELVQRVRQVASVTEHRAVADAFLASLGSRRLDLRSALGSYAVARNLPDHAFHPGQDERCTVCGLYRLASREGEDPNILGFERFKWGGVRRDDLVYVGFDLEQFQRAPKLVPTATDTGILRAVVDALASGPAELTASKAASGLLRVVPGNKEERKVLLEILGVTGVLATSRHPGFLQRWVPWADRALPSRRYVDTAYPTCWWTAADGVELDILAQVFPGA